MNREKTIVMISRDIVLSRILDRILARHYGVYLFRSIQSSIDHIYNSPPDLIILNTPETDPRSMEILSNLKSDPIFYHLPFC